MAQADCASSVFACRMRIAKLAASGVPLPGAGNLYVTDALVEIGVTPVYGAATEFEQKNGCDDICAAVRKPGSLTGYDLTMSVCRPDPEIFHMLTNGDLFVDGSNVVGYAFPIVGTSESDNNGASIEAWSKAWIDGHIADSDPYIRWVFPRTKWQHGTMTLNNGILVPTLTGTAESNTNWYNGPANDWDQDSDSPVMFARDNDMPASTCGATSLAAS